MYFDVIFCAMLKSHELLIVVFHQFFFQITVFSKDMFPPNYILCTEYHVFSRHSECIINCHFSISQFASFPKHDKKRFSPKNPKVFERQPCSSTQLVSVTIYIFEFGTKTCRIRHRYGSINIRYTIVKPFICIYPTKKYLNIH